MTLPSKKFAAILADPPWRFATWSDKGRDRCADKHYKVMNADEIANLDVESLAHDDCVLFLWVTWPMLKDGLWVMANWGFTYKTCAFAWMKSQSAGPFKRSLWRGTGYWTRANTEVCLLATRGKPKRKHRDVAQAILEPRREHSRKPDCIYERIERLVPGPYLELFSRTNRKGWTSWGLEKGKFHAG